jgi:hypothetical protein
MVIHRMTIDHHPGGEVLQKQEDDEGAGLLVIRA